MKLALIVATLSGCSSRGDTKVSAAPPNTRPAPAHDLVGWATRRDEKLHVELGERGVISNLEKLYDCKKARPPYTNYVIEIESGRAEGRYPATMARICPKGAACMDVRRAVMTIETHVDETDG